MMVFGSSRLLIWPPCSEKILFSRGYVDFKGVVQIKYQISSLSNEMKKKSFRDLGSPYLHGGVLQNQDFRCGKEL